MKNVFEAINTLANVQNDLALQRYHVRNNADIESILLSITQALEAAYTTWINKIEVAFLPKIKASNLIFLEKDKIDFDNNVIRPVYDSICTINKLYERFPNPTFRDSATSLELVHSFCKDFYANLNNNFRELYQGKDNYRAAMLSLKALCY